MDQLVIAIVGVLAIWLANDKDDTVRKWACIIGIIGQPAWFHAAWTAGQWGILFAACLYTAAWMRGVNAMWIQPYRNRRVHAYRRHRLLLRTRCAMKANHGIRRDEEARGRSADRAAQGAGVRQGADSRDGARCTHAG